MVYYLSAIYENGETKLGTFANTVFHGKSIKRKISNYRKYWEGKTDFHGNKIIGVYVEECFYNYSSVRRSYSVIF